MFLKVDWNILWTVLNLLVLYLLARRFLFTPLRRAMKARQDAIADELKRASDARAVGEELQRHNQEQMHAASRAASRLVDDARDHADQAYEIILAQAKQDSRHELEEMRVRIAREEALAKERLQTQTASLILEAAAKLASRKMTDADDLTLIDRFCRGEE
ncbi:MULTISPECIES: F0F1 ATP synthase subunit B [Jonquetella]|uniref:F0F1 ATP synthase subunit B n=1 Tax=Jonquetella TaxID=428711 RepID=UPI0003ADC93C|nr:MULTISPECIES: F0F1 ATP synthase subunit B [Jonquetella]ERL23775.1 ATP synthase F0, B subunit [Jonquetella sp. BV3C21]